MGLEELNENGVPESLGELSDGVDEAAFNAMLDKTEEISLLQEEVDTNVSTFSNYVEHYNNPEVRAKYNESKELYPGAARYVGLVEESEDLFNDVKNASQYVGVDPEFLYQIGMFEGLGRYDSLIEWVGGEEGYENTGPHAWIGYQSDYTFDSYSQIGADILLDEMPRMVELGILDKPLGYDPDMNYRQYNENDDLWTASEFEGSELWKGIAGLIKLKEHELKNMFENRDQNWDDLPETSKRSWIYAMYNRGPGVVAGNEERVGMFNEWGFDPWENPEFVEASQNEDWYQNIQKVVQGASLTETISPWSN